MKENDMIERTTKEEDARADTEVIVATIANKDMFGLLVVRYEEKFRRYLRRLGVRNEDDQDDVLQDIFIKIYKNLNGYDQTLPFSSWAYRIAHNEAITHHRRRSVRPEGHAVDDGDDVLALEGSGHSLIEELSSLDDRRVVLQAVEKLDPKYRDVVILRFFEGKEYEEIADILAMPIGSVATRIHRAKAALKGLLSHITP